MGEGPHTRDSDDFPYGADWYNYSSSTKNKLAMIRLFPKDFFTASNAWWAVESTLEDQT